MATGRRAAPTAPSSGYMYTMAVATPGGACLSASKKKTLMHQETVPANTSQKVVPRLRCCVASRPTTSVAMPLPRNKPPKRKSSSRSLGTRPVVCEMATLHSA